MRIRALSVFEGVVYHCWPVDRANPCRPALEVDALLRPGDADAESGPLLLPVADYLVMVGDLTVARRCLEELAARGRIVDHLGVDHLSFPIWERVPDPTVPDPTVDEPTIDEPTVDDLRADDGTGEDPTGGHPAAGGRPDGEPR